MANIAAVLPGTTDKDRYVIIGGHYDSIASKRGPGAARTDDEGPRTAAEMEPNASGVADDASGTAAVMELARVMSQYEFDKSIVFIAFAAEEIGLNGSKNYADEAKAKNMVIEAMLNNDIIGSDVSGNGASANNRVRLLAEGPEDSPSRAVARYAKETAERYLPSMTVDLIFRRDRFSRGGDHTCRDRRKDEPLLWVPSSKWRRTSSSRANSLGVRNNQERTSRHARSEIWSFSSLR